MMKTLGNPEITAELKQTITQGALREAGNRFCGAAHSVRKRDVTWTC
ncbi:MAG: hypothetical protein WA323_07775 [Candidatus Nitrosopolaris sp.]